MDVRVLEYLMMIEQEKSISKAAEKVHISQSALSQCLAKIEKELDRCIGGSLGESGDGYQHGRPGRGQHPG